MTTTELALALKKIHKRKFVASELNGYAKQLGRTIQAGLIVPVEVADSFIIIDNHTANGIIRPLIERLECTKASLL